MLAGDLEGAQKELDQALQISSKFGERVYLPQILLIEATIARGKGDARHATDSVRRAISEAKAQGAAWFELHALTELIEHGGATPDDRRALAALAKQLPEASGTAAFAKANASLRAAKLA